jgi:hypothetical protein
MPEPRYDPDEDVSRHAVSDVGKCLEIRDRYKWNLRRSEQTSDPILPVDCVFEGKTEFPKPFNELAEDEDDE